MIQVYRTNGTVETLHKLPCAPTLDAIGKYLFGDKADLMEHIRVLEPETKATPAQLWVHESGRLLRLHINLLATKLYLAHHSEEQCNMLISEGACIVGDALLLTGSDQLE